MCEHKNWINAGYVNELYGKKVVQLQSMYHVYCYDCEQYVNLLSGKPYENQENMVSINAFDNEDDK
jgi:hypothetical protein